MYDFAKHFLTAFIPMFVAMDCIGLLPLYVSLTESEDKEKKQQILRQATLTAGALGIVFTFLGLNLFKFLGITVPDFMVGGGIVLLILAITDLLFPDRSRSTTSLGVVPLGIPLIVGPSVLTTLVLQVDLVGTATTLISFVANILITYFVFKSAGLVVKVMGEAASHAVSKIANLFLAAIAVMLIRRGVIEIIHMAPP